ncbi:MAG: hypothetical protein Q8O29_11545 [Polaromonas sp.]|uniref:hypothetical protein n=1 Tax=Polaromonas sp. TaxID=1869339 RepID=UPI002735C3EF|nr:hypothetical protein [Polaromonas sp.]MDP2818884.1 hypothetical protein [Polaromonas sp.]
MRHSLPSVRSRVPQNGHDGLNKRQHSERTCHENPSQKNQTRIFGSCRPELRDGKDPKIKTMDKAIIAAQKKKLPSSTSF